MRQGSQAVLGVPTSKWVVSLGGDDHLSGTGTILVLPVGNAWDPSIFQRVKILN